MLFLKHFYSVYDFDKDTLSLGVNMHSNEKVSMYKPGNRPDNLVKAQISVEGDMTATESGDKS
jgi:hypothetical protein